VSLRDLARDSAVFTFANVAPKAGAFLLLPIYVRFLSQADYGAVALLTSFAGILAVVAHLGVDSALMRLHFDAEGWARRRLYFTVALFSAVASAVLTVIVAVVVGPFFETLFSGIAFLPLGALALLVAFAGSLQFIPSVLFRASGQARRYLVINLGAFVSGSVASVVLVVVFGLGAAGVLGGQLIANLAVLVVVVVIVVRLGTTDFDAKALRSSLRLGLPLLPHQLSAWALRLADRWLLAIFLVLPSLEARAQIGVYAVGYQLGYLITILVTSFNAAWSPYFFRIGDRQEAPRFLGDMSNLVIAGLLAVAVGLSCLAPEIVAVIARPGYEDAADVMQVIAFASVLQGAYTMFVTAVFFVKRTAPLALITFGAAALNILLNVDLIPILGIIGAAWATFGAYFVFAAATYQLARRIYPVDIDWIRVGLLAALAAMTVAAARIVSSAPSVEGFVVHAALAVGFALITAWVCLRPLGRLRIVSRSLPADVTRRA
jgi:O-antigen/teichoic acid export membrane protein